MKLAFRIVNRLGSVATILALSTLAVFACQVAPYKPSKFDPTEYVFIGEVTGYTESIDFERNRPPYSDLLQDESLKRTNGLLVKVTDVVYIPTKQSEFEVFVYGMGSGCESLGRTLERLKNDFPIGTEVIVVAQEAFQIPKKSASDGIRLEINFPRGIFEPTLSKITPNSVFDFSKVAPKKKEWLNRFTRGAFEVRKEMLRLDNATDAVEKKNILSRLLSMDYQADLIDLYGLATYYSSSLEFGESQVIEKLVNNGVKRSHAQEFLKCSRSEDRKRVPFYSICQLPPRNE
jgi:hypothetical protein